VLTHNLCVNLNAEITGYFLGVNSLLCDSLVSFALKNKR
jgi:hypothetical protein